MYLIYLYVIPFRFFLFSFLFNQVIPSFYLLLSFLKSSDFDELRIQCLFTENYLIILENDYRHVAPGRRGDLPSPPPALFVSANIFLKFTHLEDCYGHVPHYFLGLV